MSFKCVFLFFSFFLSIFSSGSHFAYRSGTSLDIFVGIQLGIIPVKSESKRLTGLGCSTLPELCTDFIVNGYTPTLKRRNPTVFIFDSLLNEN